MNHEDLRKLAEAAVGCEDYCGDNKYAMMGFTDTFTPTVAICLLDTIKQQRELLEDAKESLTQYGKDSHPGYESVVLAEIAKHLQQQEGEKG